MIQRDTDLDARARQTAEVFLEWIAQARRQVTPDGRVGEAVAADLLGRAQKTLSNMRSAGVGPAFFKAGGRAEYRVIDLALWLEASRESTINDVTL